MENQKKEKTTEASLEKQQKKLKNRKKLKYGGLATAITVIFVAVVVLVNVVVTQLDKRFPNAKLDLTTANLYEISDETLDYIRNLDKDVDVAISSDEATFTSDKYNKMIAETLSKYQGYSDRINVTYFDTTKDPDVLSKYQELYGGSIQSGQVIINSGKRIKVYNTQTDMFEVDQQKYQYYQYGMASFSDCITAFKGEQTLTSGIMNVTDSNPKTVGILATSNGSPIFAQTSSSADPNTYAFYAMENLLDENGYVNTPIMSYSVKYASAFYGPFRDAAGSAPAFGDRKSYQMDPHNAREALLEAELDVQEGADILMVKPGMAYLDVLRSLKEKFHQPVALYSVSGEYAMIQAAAAAGYVDREAVICESAVCMYRAGADLLITYFAMELAQYIREGRIG